MFMHQNIRGTDISLWPRDYCHNLDQFAWKYLIVGLFLGFLLCPCSPVMKVTFALLWGFCMSVCIYVYIPNISEIIRIAFQAIGVGVWTWRNESYMLSYWESGMEACRSLERFRACWIVLEKHMGWRKYNLVQSCPHCLLGRVFDVYYPQKLCPGINSVTASWHGPKLCQRTILRIEQYRQSLV